MEILFSFFNYEKTKLNIHIYPDNQLPRKRFPRNFLKPEKIHYFLKSTFTWDNHHYNSGIYTLNVRKSLVQFKLLCTYLYKPPGEVATCYQADKQKTSEEEEQYACIPGDTDSPHCPQDDTFP